MNRSLQLNIRRCNPWIGGLLMAGAALAGCAPKTNVSATGNAPAQYQHVFMSVNELWFNTSATAGPDDATWTRFPLNTPVTLDLAGSAGGTLQSITRGLGLGVGAYAQVRLIPVDATAPLLSSASNLGALYNSEADYLDSTGALHQVPLELQNPDKGIGIPTSIQVKGQSTNVFAATASSTSSGTPSAATSSSSSSTSNQPFTLAINLDGATDLVPFAYATATGMLLNPHITAYDASAVGAVQGTLNLAGLSGLAQAGNSTYVNIQVTAESLSADGARHVAINSAPVRSDGTFTLYPLTATSSSSASSSPASYDLVIHGPEIESIIVKGVTVKAGDPSATTPVNIGAITPAGATSFAVNLTNTSTVNPTTTSPLPAGALVGFYQTLPGNGEVPYLIEQQPIDPFSRIFESDKALSRGALRYGTFSSSGSDVTLSSSSPAEGASTYGVGASAPLFTDGALTTTVTAPAPGSSSIILTVPTLSVASGATPNTPVVTISQATPGTFNQGDLIISHDGAIVATAPLDSLLATGTIRSLTIPRLPGGGFSGVFASGLYYVSVRVWNSGNPSGTLKREIYPAALDLRTGSFVNYSLVIN